MSGEYPEHLYLGPVNGLTWEEYIRLVYHKPQFVLQRTDATHEEHRGNLRFDDPFSGDIGQVTRIFGPAPADSRMFFPKYGERNYYKIEVKVKSSGRNSHHREGDRCVWSIPEHLIPKHMKAFWGGAKEAEPKRPPRPLATKKKGKGKSKVTSKRRRGAGSTGKHVRELSVSA